MGIKVDLDDLREYIQQGHLSKLYYGYTPQNTLENLTLNLLVAFELEQAGHKNATKDFVKIFRILKAIPHYFEMQSINMKTINLKSHLYNIEISNVLKELDYLINYDGVWNIKEILEINSLNIETIYKIKNDILKEINPSEEETKIRYIQDKKLKEKCKKNFIKNYYEKSGDYELEDIEKYLGNKKFMSKNEIDKNDIRYPMIINLYQNGKIIYIGKIRKNLKGSLKSYRKTKNFDDYSLSLVPENLIDDLYIESLIKEKPINVPTNLIRMEKHGKYRSITQMKSRFKDDFDIRFIRKIIIIYDVPYYKFTSGAEIVHRDKFDEALKKYYDEKK